MKRENCSVRSQKVWAALKILHVLASRSDMDLTDPGRPTVLLLIWNSVERIFLLEFSFFWFRERRRRRRDHRSQEVRHHLFQDPDRPGGSARSLYPRRSLRQPAEGRTGRSPSQTFLCEQKWKNLSSSADQWKCLKYFKPAVPWTATTVKFLHQYYLISFNI